MRIYNKYKEDIIKIEDALTICDFEDLSSENFYEQIIVPFRQKYKEKVNYDTGATKGVLLFKEKGFVIKIPFQVCDDSYLCGVVDGDTDWDYCSQEVYRYELAEKYEVEKFFLPSEFIEYVNDEYPIYIQEYAEIGESIDSIEASKEERDSVENFNSKNFYKCINLNWEAKALSIFGEDKFLKFKNFIVDNDINDLHLGNIGYKNNIPVLVDYAGFDN